MIGLGTIINTAAIILGGIFGFFFGKLLKPRHCETLTMACGVSTLFIGIAGAMQGMLSIDVDVLKSGKGMIVVICLVLGGFVGELINIEGLFERFGNWLKVKTGNSEDVNFVNGFLTASLTVCIGAMAIVGSIEDGINGDWTILAIKGILDFIIVMVLTPQLGKGCTFSAIPVFILEGLMTLLARLISPVLTDLAMFNISFIGSILIFCVGLNIIWGKKIRVANFIPALIFAIIFAFLPFAL